MGTTTDGLSYWQAESEEIDLLDTTIGDLLDRRADELPTQEAIRRFRASSGLWRAIP